MRLPIHPTQAVGILATLTIVMIVVSMSFLLWDLHGRQLQRSHQMTVSLAHLVMEQSEQNFESTDLVLRGVQERLQTPFGSRSTLDSPAIHLLLATRVAGLHQLDSLFIVNANGTIVNSSRDIAGTTVAVGDQEYFKTFAEHADSGLFISHPRHNLRNSDWTLYLARSFLGSDGKFRGVIVAAVSISQLEQIFKLMRLDYIRPISIYLADGTLVASIPHREALIGVHGPELLGLHLPRSSVDLSIFRQAGVDGHPEYFALGHLTAFPLLIGVANDDDEVLAPWREAAAPITLGSGLVCIAIAAAAALIAREVRRQEALRRELSAANEHYFHTFDSVMDAIVATDREQRIVLFNPAAERMFGHSAASMIGQSLAQLMPVAMRAPHHIHVDRFLHSAITSRSMAPQLNITGLRADGSEFPIESTISRTLIGGKPQLTAVLRDVTERRRAEDNLREMNRQLRELSSALQDVREQERTRIARELHDELGQQLTGLKLDFSWLCTRLKDGRPAPYEKVDEMRHLLDTAIASVRHIATELRPLILDDLGFGDAVTWLTADVAKRSGLSISLELPAAALVCDGDLATALFRIAQESLTNIVRHAEATAVKISLVADDDSLVLTVSDDGQGIAEGARQKKGVGLMSMRERATALGGNIRISSAPGVGTTIEVILPVNLAAAVGEAR